MQNFKKGALMFLLLKWKEQENLLFECDLDLNVEVKVAPRSKHYLFLINILLSNRTQKIMITTKINNILPEDPNYDLGFDLDLNFQSFEGHLLN